MARRRTGRDILLDILAELKSIRKAEAERAYLPTYHRAVPTEGHVASGKCWCASWTECVDGQYYVTHHGRVN